MDDWIVGRVAIMKFLKKGSWRSVLRWVRKYKPPLRRWIDGKPAFLRAEINEWLIRTGEEVQEKYFNDPK